MNAPYHRPVSTRHFRSDSNVTSTRLSEMRASCRASWQSPSSSVQCFHWDRLYSEMSVGIGATVIARVVAGLAAGGGASVVGSWVGVDVAASVEDAGVGVGMMFVGDGGMGLGSAVAATDVGGAAGIGAWPEQATKTMRIGTSVQIGSLVIRVLLSF